MIAAKPFFESFPLLRYDLLGTREYITIRHIIPRVKMIDLVKNTSGNYHVYRIPDNETVGHVAHKAYGDERWYWVILIYNNIIDVFEDWPMSTNDFMQFLTTKYGANQNNAIHHYVDSFGNEVQPAFSPGAVGITNYAYEYEINQARRQIKVPHPQYLPVFQQQLEDALRDA